MPHVLCIPASCVWGTRWQVHRKIQPATPMYVQFHTRACVSERTIRILHTQAPTQMSPAKPIEEILLDHGSFEGTIWLYISGKTREGRPRKIRKLLTNLNFWWNIRHIHVHTCMFVLVPVYMIVHDQVYVCEQFLLKCDWGNRQNPLPSNCKPSWPFYLVSNTCSSICATCTMEWNGKQTGLDDHAHVYNLFQSCSTLLLWITLASLSIAYLAKTIDARADDERTSPFINKFCHLFLRAVCLLQVSMELDKEPLRMRSIAIRQEWRIVVFRRQLNLQK